MHSPNTLRRIGFFQGIPARDQVVVGASDSNYFQKKDDSTWNFALIVLASTALGATYVASKRENKSHRVLSAAAGGLAGAGIATVALGIVGFAGYMLGYKSQS